MGLKHKIAATVAAAATLLSGLAITGTAMADEVNPNSKGKLTVTANEDISKRTFKAVPLAYYSYVQTDSNNITGFGLVDAGKAKAITDALSNAQISTSSKKDAVNGYDYDKNNPMEWVVQNLLDSDTYPYAGKLRNFLDKLKNEDAVTNDKDATPFTSSDGITGQQTAQVRPGVYAVVDTPASGPASIVMLNGTGANGKTTLKNGDKTYTLGAVDYKVHNGATISKKITDAENGVVENDGTTAETSIGKQVTFEVNSTIPNWTGYDNFYYAINDIPDTGLTFVSNAVGGLKVQVGDRTLSSGNDYRVLTADGKIRVVLGGTANGITSITNNSTRFPVGAAVKVTYKMTVNGNAKAGTAIVNKAEVEYSQNPNNVEDHKTVPSNEVKVYVGGFDLTKKDNIGNLLAGAEFQVYEGTKTNSNPVKFVKSEDGLTYRKSDSSDNGATTTVTSVATNGGKITLTGLDGQYTVKETKSPLNGPFLPTFTLTIKVNQKDGTYTLSQFEDTGKNNMVSENADKKGVTVINVRNIMDMPKTGAVWMSIFGIMTVLLAGASMILLRRKA